MSIRNPATAFLCVVAVTLMLSLGCNTQEGRIARFIPSQTAAEAALNSVLSAWSEGASVGPVPKTQSPVIHVTDSFRKPGETLTQFKVLGEVPGDTPRCYAVELRFVPERIEKVRFVVVGIDPLWVFRMEDYQLLSHWEHNMTNQASDADATADGRGGGPVPNAGER